MQYSDPAAAKVVITGATVPSEDTTKATVQDMQPLGVDTVATLEVHNGAASLIITAGKIKTLTLVERVATVVSNHTATNKTAQLKAESVVNAEVRAWM